MPGDAKDRKKLTFQGLALSQVDVRGIVEDRGAVTAHNGLQVAVVCVIKESLHGRLATGEEGGRSRRESKESDAMLLFEVDHFKKT